MIKSTSQLGVKTHIRTILWITMFWAILGLLQYLYEDAVLIEYDLLKITTFDRIFWRNLSLQFLTYGIIGFVGATVIVYFVQPWFRTLAYGRALLYVVISYTLLFVVLTAVQILIILLIAVEPERIWEELLLSLKIYFFSSIFIKYFFFWLLVVIGTSVGLFVSDKYGPGVITNLLLGKYFKPRNEQRIFMFLDLKGSTTIAEKLGEVPYFNFIKETFSDVTKPILKTKGEIYQYVGDEIVISWKYKKGIENANCVTCYFEIKNTLEDLEAKYQSKYGVSPVFKAGIHCGNVIAGEIGIIKRDITYSGDVLNTTARIQSKCNEYSATCLISGDLVKLLGEKIKDYKTSKLGDVVLRGKELDVSLYSVLENDVQ